MVSDRALWVPWDPAHLVASLEKACCNETSPSCLRYHLRIKFFGIFLFLSRISETFQTPNILPSIKTAGEVGT